MSDVDTGALRAKWGPYAELGGAASTQIMALCDALDAARERNAYQVRLMELLAAKRNAAEDELDAARARIADAWDEGYEAGHTDARAVQATYPAPTLNPYRSGVAQPADHIAIFDGSATPGLETTP